MSLGSEALPESFDTIIVGTGLCESVLAAAFSRIGYSVLHLDRNPYYGELESTHSLNALLKYSELHAEGLPSSPTDHPLEDGEVRISVPFASSHSLTNISYTTYDVSEDERTRCMQIIEREKTAAAAVAASAAAVSAAEAAASDLTTVTDEPKPAAEEAQDGGGDAMECADKPSEEATEAPEVVECQPEQDEVAAVNPVVMSYISSANEEGSEVERRLGCLRSRSNRFILDLSPKLLFARSEMIELLIGSDVARYCEFRTITQILTLNDNGALEVVPCNRSDIFATKTLSMIEKRILMKLLTLCMDFESKKSEYEEFASRPFVEFLRSQKLTNNLVNYVVHAIAMVPKTASTLQGLKRTQLFIKSLGRYGPTPFLWPLYGGEINQAFCRMSAVFGGVYILHRTISQIVVNESQSIVSHIICNEGVKIKCKWLICNAGYMGESMTGSACKYISRAIVISSDSLSPTGSDREEAVLLSIPSLDGRSDPVTVVELGAAACVCPKDPANLRVVHLTTRSRSTAQADLEVYVEQLFSKYEGGGKPRLLLACYFNMPDYSEGRSLTPTHPGNLFIAPGPDARIDSDHSVVEAKRIFSEICPDDKFLPRPPNPEDIIYCDEETKTQSNGETFTEEVREVTADNQPLAKVDEGVAPADTVTARDSSETDEVKVDSTERV